VNRLVLFMARYRLLWLLWLSLGTPFVLLSMTLTVLVETLRHIRSMWGWTWKYDVKQYLEAFGERHRKAQRSLGLRPRPGGMVQRS
jgi:hypothetical protein